MKEMAAQKGVIIEDRDHDKKKKRRPDRRPKQTAPTSPAGCCSVNRASIKASPTEGMIKQSNSGDAAWAAVNCGELPALSPKQSVVNGSYMFHPLTRHTSCTAELDAGNWQYLFTHNQKGSQCSKHFRSCPGGILSSCKMNGLNLHKSGDVSTEWKCFSPHWSIQTVNHALENGDVFSVLLRVNAYNQQEGYCTIDGLFVDVLISGAMAQNRAIEGDTVAIMLDPVTSWLPLKGGPGRDLPVDESVVLSDVSEVVDSDCIQNNRIKSNLGCLSGQNGLIGEHTFLNEASSSDRQGEHGFQSIQRDEQHWPLCVNGDRPANALRKLKDLVSSFPPKRPTGRVLAILENSPRRNAVVGFLSVKEFLSCKKGCKKESGGQLSKRDSTLICFFPGDYIHLIPKEPKFPKMMVHVGSLPSYVKDRLRKGDHSLETELMAAKIGAWGEESFLPHAEVLHALGRSGEIETEVAAILFGNMLCDENFSPDALACLPSMPWEIPAKELQRRKDLRDWCTLTIDPLMASEFDDALSVEKISSDTFRVGVHIADVSFFVPPGTVLDKEAQIRSTSIYLVQHKLSMLPPHLSQGMASLKPGADRLTISMTWDINLEGEVISRWVGHTMIRSCCKLSYSLVQKIIDGSLDTESLSPFSCELPEVHGQFAWADVTTSIRSLYEISKRLRGNRYKDGGLELGNSKLVVLIDDHGLPYDCLLSGQTDSNYLVEEFMLLANKTAAEVISRAFPDCALLRRHPEPNLRKLKAFEAFCWKHGFELDTSSAFQLHHSLQRIQAKLKNDPVLFDIIIYYASRSMQLAAYFNSGDLRGRENEWSHYSLGVPVYTHFTSPLRRYSDIVVHRTLAAVLDAQKSYMQKREADTADSLIGKELSKCCFTGLDFDKEAADSMEGKKLLSDAALKHVVPSGALLTDVATHCNVKSVARQHAEDACTKLYFWALLKKESVVTEARVLGLGPKFMQVYLEKYSMERRIYCGESDVLIVEWLEATSTLLLDLRQDRQLQRKARPGSFRNITDATVVVNAGYLNMEGTLSEGINCQVSATPTEVGLAGKFPNSTRPKVEPAVFPLTVKHLSSVPVVVDAVGGLGMHCDIVARLYISSYLID